MSKTSRAIGRIGTRVLCDFTVPRQHLGPVDLAERRFMPLREVLLELLPVVVYGAAAAVFPF
jgi:hypothetical protein